MYDPDSKKNPHRTEVSTAQPDHLLDELASIKALLDGEQGATTTPVPLLDDVVGFAAVDDAPHAGLLDLGHIFGDDAAPSIDAAADRVAFPKFTLDVALSDAPAEPASANPVYNPNAQQRRAALVQELVAEFLPQIEAALRERLERLDEETLRALHEPD